MHADQAKFVYSPIQGFQNAMRRDVGPHLTAFYSYTKLVILLEGPEVCIDDVTENGCVALKITWTHNAEVNTSNRK